MDNIYDLDEYRQKKAADSWAQEDAFRMLTYHFDDYDIGLIDENGYEISLLINPDTLDCICMSKEDAFKLGNALIAASSPRINRHV